MTDNYRKPAGSAPVSPDEERVARFLVAARRANERSIFHGGYRYDVRVGKKVDVSNRICEVYIFEMRRLVWWKFWTAPVLCLVEVELVRGFSSWWHKPDGSDARTPWEVMCRAIKMHEVLEEAKGKT